MGSFWQKGEEMMKPIFEFELSKETFSKLKKDRNVDKELFISFLKNGKLVSIGGIIIDFSTNEWTNTENLDYESGDFYWNSSDIYHFEKYDLKLNDDFIKYVIRETAQQ